MTGKELAAACGFTLACGTGEREIEGGIYCCDLLSIVMGRAPADGLWVTVMGNMNTLAVAALADAACVIMAENAHLDQTAMNKARVQGITVLETALPIFDAALKIFRLLPEGGEKGL